MANGATNEVRTFNLRVLGGFALEASAGAAFPVPQPRAEAILAVLAVCGDVGCTRERLIALLWPESDEERGRRALRNTLHTIRRALGSEAVSSAGELLRLDPAAVASDVGAFLEARNAARLVDAVEAYGGDLLEGFHVDAAPEFERWLDGERARLARQYLEACGQLATAAEAAGAWGEAANWWAQAAERDPVNSHFVLRHAEALAAIGDRANAIRIAEAHERRLRDEFELDVDPQIHRRFEQIRHGEVRSPAMAGSTSSSSGPAIMTASGEAATRLVPLARRQRRLPVAGAALAALLLVAAGVLVPRLLRRAADGPALDRRAIAVLPFQVVGTDSAAPARQLARAMGALFELKVTRAFGRRILHPGSVAERWRAAGGTLDSALPEAAELDLARSMGAGLMVRGTIAAEGDSLALAASLVDVASGRTRAMPPAVTGPAARQQQLVDRLIILLLAEDAGFTPELAPRLLQFRPEAIQAYLAGNLAPTFAEQKALYRAALAADSTLVDAAVMTYAVGENVRDTVELRYAWDHRDLLSERSQAYLPVIAAGRHGPIRSEADKLAGYEALARRWPEWRTPWGELGDQLLDYGALAGVADWNHRARDAFDRMDRHADWVWWHYTELAFADGDAARAGAAIDSLATFASVSRRVPSLVAAYRWRLSVLRGETAEAARRLARLPDVTEPVQFALTDGRGVSPELDSAAQRAATVAAMWAWARGHERQWREAWRRYGSPAGELSQATAPIFWALLLGPSADSLAAPALRALEQIAAARRRRAIIGPDDRALARCWLALWRLEHSDTTGARATRRYLESDADRRHRFAAWSRLIDVLMARADGGDVHAALLGMDSAVRALPLPTGHLQWDPLPSEVHNLWLARMLARYGEPRLALAAARRRMYRAVLNYPDALPEYLREEGRLAAATGDTAGAIRAYRHYLALREDPDPPWRATRDSVRHELAAVAGR